MDGGLDVLLFGEALIDELPRGRVPGGAPLDVACHLRGALPRRLSFYGKFLEAWEDGKSP